MYNYEDFEPEFLNPKRNIVEANKYINSVIPFDYFTFA